VLNDPRYVDEALNHLLNIEEKIEEL
jgi:hypothetical protein